MRDLRPSVAELMPKRGQADRWRPSKHALAYGEWLCDECFSPSFSEQHHCTCQAGDRPLCARCKRHHQTTHREFVQVAGELPESLRLDVDRRVGGRR